MNKYLKDFETHSDYVTFTLSANYIKPNVSICEQEDDIHYNGHDYSEDYLTFRILENGTVTFRGVPDDSGINYSKDDGQTWSGIGYVNPLTVNKGDKILFKATNPTISSSTGMGKFGSTCKFTVEGNIMSLHFGDNFENLTDLTGKNYAFKYLFTECTNLISASKLILPATTLSSECYSNMFDGCTSLITAPELPATTLTSYCYAYMFQGCTSLIIAPTLSATTLTNRCYSLMFCDCTNLSKITCLATDISADECTKYWVYNVASTGTFTKAASMTWPTGAQGIPTGWTVQTASA